MPDYSIRPIIGLEIHVQLSTRSKLFCNCKVEFAAEPNSRVCPVCMGMPGTLPVMNRTAFEHSVKAGLALNCKVAPFTKWDRKSYYYPDLPKNYQISQYDLPLSHDGHFDIPLGDGSIKAIGIIRAHLEEDAGKNMHEGLDHTRVDLNRTGTPLLEIVTQPDLANADEAYAFCTELQRLVRFLGISEADMQKGQMRFEPNVNVAITQDGREYRTPISEVKNLNSFRSVRLAIRYEIDRQIKAWEADHDYTLQKKGKMNFGWNDAKEVTEFQRGKEESHDYRYFPDPDLVPVTTDDAFLDRMRRQVGELPLAKQRRFIDEYGMTEKDCEIILADRETSVLYEDAMESGVEAKTLTKHFVGIWNHLASAADTTVGKLGMPASCFSELVKLVNAGTISATAASQVAERIYQTRDKEGTSSPLETAKQLGVIQERDEAALQSWVDEAFQKNPQAIQDALSSKEKKVKAAAGFLRGQVMRISQGKADPRLAGELIEKKIDELKARQN
ncbi:MAG: Asp-tRNA(Asn)/Glu-tRNA(Gln) amidotransferase subunit GatB [Phycisphaerales bacterium]|nr:Asp-tRNA(Asn)/Glu-tRNA(Gln) amidotransferase subunit GatB [Phycisphaerales bacterium]